MTLMWRPLQLLKKWENSKRGIITGHCISSELLRKVRVSEEILILRFEGQVSSIFKLKWVEEVKLCRKKSFDDCSIA